ncbi:MAG: DUF1549 and DUF1553 domain-containing protein [Verrucomicrobiales bacterium]
MRHLVFIVASMLLWEGSVTLWGGEQKTASKAATHWAFQPIRKVTPPQVGNETAGLTNMDRFIVSALEKAGLQLAPAADKRTLVRRATFDLTGLPPTPEEVEAFLQDNSPDAFSKVVERLLNSPHYGERWARHWLDVARYADNKGYVFFENRDYPWAWSYRDYVVKSFNSDKPYDRFIMEQLAADQLDLREDPDALTAIGFLTVGDHFSNNTHDIMDDRIDVVTRGLLGLTVSCARCHDHKYDPIQAADYYSMYGVFRSSVEPIAGPPIGKPALNEQFEFYELELVTRERKLRDFVEAKHSEIVLGARSRISEYLATVYAQRNQPPTESFMLIADPGDVNPAVVARWRAYLEKKGPDNAIWGPWNRFAALNETNFVQGAAQVVETMRQMKLNEHVAAVFAVAAPRSISEVHERYSALLSLVNAKWLKTLAGEKETGAKTERLQDATEETLRLALYGPDSPCEVPAQMDWGFLSLLPDRASQGQFQALLKSFEEWLTSGPEAPARAMALYDSQTPYEPRIFQRGNPTRLGEPVTRQFISFLNSTGEPFKKGSGRLELAEAISSPQNPLTARVFVNRVWMHHFGRGLVTTPSDFGMRSEPPSHPELLDWLATKFITNGWKVKDLHRWIMLSAVYQQGISPADLKALEIDPENKLLSRMNPRRHDYETLRDSLLAVSGKIQAQVGGAPLQGAHQRRSIYSYIDRMDIPPVLTTFDFPSPSASCPERNQTTVAPQALFLMNNSFVAECADALLQREDVKSQAAASDKIKRIYQLAYGRDATDKDLEKAERFLGPSPTAKEWTHFAHAVVMANEFTFVD